MNIKEKITTDLDIPSKLIDEALAYSRRYVKKFYITKRDGRSKRVIYQPSKKLKTIQYWLIANIFEKLDIHRSSSAYIKGESILTNAERHRGNQYFLKMDFKDFFPSIKWKDLKPILSAWEKTQDLEWALDDDAMELIRQSCFYLNDSLPVGYPSSPIISNVVMYALDEKIEMLLNNPKKYGQAVYSRYADDIVISTNIKGICNDIRSSVSELIRMSESPKLSFNPTKTRLGSSTSGSAIVTGLRVCTNGHITIHRKQKDHIRLLLALYRKEQLSSDEEASLLGHLAYVQYVAPEFYSKLQNKYFKEIRRLKFPNE